MDSINILSIALSFIIVNIEMICCQIFFNTLLLKKGHMCSKKKISVIEFFCLVFSNFLITNYTTGYIQIIFIIISYLCITHLFYEDSLIKKLFISLCIYLLIIFVDILSVQIIYLCSSLSLSKINEVPLFFFMAATFSKTCLFITVVTIKILKSTKHNLKLKNFSKYNLYIYFLQSITSMICIMSINYMSYQIGSVPLIAIIAAVSLLYLNSAIFSLLEKATQLDIREHEHALYRQQLETSMENLLIFSQSFNTKSSLLHDYNQQLSAIYQLISDGNVTVAQELIHSISNEIYVALYRFKTNNKIIDAVLNQKYMQANNCDVILDIRASDLSQIKIKDCYLVTILSNAIENAIEACKELDSKKIVKIKLIIEDNIFIFSVINPVKNSVTIINNTVKTTKSDELIHGLGLKNIYLALEKCNGDYELICEKDFFQFTAFMRLSEN